MSNYIQMSMNALVIFGSFVLVLFVIALGLMVVAGFQMAKDEFSGGTHRSRGRAKRNKEFIAHHRVETPTEKAKRELREEKARLARENAFFDNYYAHGDIVGLERLERGEMPSPAYNLDNTGVNILRLELDLLDVGQQEMTFN